MVLITGVSGSGKSTAANSLEDLGFYCVDNLPLPLLRTFLADPFSLVGDWRRVAVVADVRAPGFAEQMPALVSEIDRRRIDFVMIFLDASEDSLVRRFSETRRIHPLGSGGRPVVEGIRREREILADVRAAADLVLDTTDWSIHDIRREINRELGGAGEAGSAMVVSLVSFGFKHGQPTATDLLFDVRFLPNPFFRPDLRDKSGRDPEVCAYLEAEPAFEDFLNRLVDFLRYLLPRYQAENRAYLSVAVGCTGGRHRSVAVCEQVAERLAGSGLALRVHHRDIDR